MKIVNTTNLRVEQIGKLNYLTWITSPRILFVPKICCELNNDGKIKVLRVNGFVKSVLLNFSFAFAILLIYLYIKFQDFSKIIDFIPLLIGLIVLLVIVNFIIIETTKREVKKQID